MAKVTLPIIFEIEVIRPCPFPAFFLIIFPLNFQQGLAKHKMLQEENFFLTILLSIYKL